MEKVAIKTTLSETSPEVNRNLYVKILSNLEMKVLIFWLSKISFYFKGDGDIVLGGIQENHGQSQPGTVNYNNYGNVSGGKNSFYLTITDLLCYWLKSYWHPILKNPTKLSVQSSANNSVLSLIQCDLSNPQAH